MGSKVSHRLVEQQVGDRRVLYVSFVDDYALFIYVNIAAQRITLYTT